MGMTIAEPIQTLEYLRDSGVFPFSTKEGVLHRAESIDVAVETMRKYKKIEDIYYHQSGEALENSLRAVIEDGKID